MAMLNNQMVYNRDLHVRLNQFIRIPLHLIPSFFHGQNIREHRGTNPHSSDLSWYHSVGAYALFA